MYIEASSPRVMGDKAKLELSLCGNGDEACLTFYYHMYGNTTGTLNVFSGSKVVFSASGLAEGRTDYLFGQSCKSLKQYHCFFFFQHPYNTRCK